MATKVLVVDDAHADRVNMESILGDAGYTVVTAKSGKEALSKVSSDRPDLVLLDIVMDDMDGFKTCRTLSEDPATADIPIVMVTGNTQKVHKEWATQQGAKGYVTKPYTPESLLAQVSELV